MTFKKFEELLKTKYPEAEPCPHGKFGGTEGSGYVEINFKPNSRCYTYRGSYMEILNRLGVKAVYKRDIERAEKDLKYYKENDGKISPFTLFGNDDCRLDYTQEIKHLEAYLKERRSGDYIIL